MNKRYWPPSYCLLDTVWGTVQGPLPVSGGGMSRRWLKTKDIFCQSQIRLWQTGAKLFWPFASPGIFRISYGVISLLALPCTFPRGKAQAQGKSGQDPALIGKAIPGVSLLEPSDAAQDWLVESRPRHFQSPEKDLGDSQNLLGSPHSHPPLPAFLLQQQENDVPLHANLHLIPICNQIYISSAYVTKSL